MNYDELVTFIIRETGWTLEYVRKLHPKDLYPLVEELSYQKAVDDYKLAYNAAMIAGMLAKKGTTIQGLIGEPPTRRKEKGGEDIWSLAKKQGIKPPRT